MAKTSLETATGRKGCIVFNDFFETTWEEVRFQGLDTMLSRHLYCPLTAEDVKAAVIAKRRKELADLEFQVAGAKMRLRDAEEA
jgi:hypothetical protein